MSRITNEKDYYQILGVTREATFEEVKKAYRQLALQFHPDRNPGDKEAEERFKEISEAYGVLIDPEKRRHFDFISQSRPGTGRRPDFSYTQEEIFRDIFNNPMANDVFSDLGREFARMGIRFDEGFFDNLFFGGRGVYFGRIIIGGPGGFRFDSFDSRETPQRSPADLFPPLFEKVIVPPGVGWKGRLFSWLVRRGVGFFLRRLFPEASVKPGTEDLDLTYSFPLERNEISPEATKELNFARNGKTEKIVVKIPPGVQEGTLIRLRGMGKTRADKTGDLYLRVKLK